MKRNPEEKKDNFYCLVGVLVGLGLILAGIFGIVFSRIDAREYKNSTDIRTVNAVVEWFDLRKEKDRYDRWRIKEYDVKISFDVDGKKYVTKGTIVRSNDAFQERINQGSKIDIEVYRTSKGEYKIPSDNNPVDFLLYCVAIPAGMIVVIAMVSDARTRKMGKQKMKEDAKKKNEQTGG